jgi:hypothetical protein
VFVKLVVDRSISVSEGFVRRPELIAIGMLVIAVLGCGQGASKPKGMGTVAVSSYLYDDCYRANGGQAPSDEQAFRQFLTTRQTRLNESGMTADDVFKSPRTGGPIQWVYGATPPTSRETGIVFVGYETEPVDGKRLVIAMRGISQEMDDAKFRTLFPNAP